jgi:hypothetical protein
MEALASAFVEGAVARRSGFARAVVFAESSGKIADRILSERAQATDDALVFARNVSAAGSST